MIIILLYMWFLKQREAQELPDNFSVCDVSLKTTCLSGIIFTLNLILFRKINQLKSL